MQVPLVGHFRSNGNLVGFWILDKENVHHIIIAIKVCLTGNKEYEYPWGVIIIIIILQTLLASCKLISC